MQSRYDGFTTGGRINAVPSAVTTVEFLDLNSGAGGPWMAGNSLAILFSLNQFELSVVFHLED